MPNGAFASIVQDVYCGFKLQNSNDLVEIIKTKNEEEEEYSRIFSGGYVKLEDNFKDTSSHMELSHIC
jgi:hypothetical protein